MTSKEITKRLLKGLGFCENCRLAAQLNFIEYDPFPPPGSRLQPGTVKKEKKQYLCLRERDWINNKEYRNHCDKWEIISSYVSQSGYVFKRGLTVEDRITTENLVIDVSIDGSLRSDKKYKKTVYEFRISLRDTFNPEWRKVVEGVINDGL